MASSGSFLSSGWYSSGKGDYVYLKFAWNVAETSVENNTKKIYWELTCDRTSTTGWVTSGAFKVVIDGVTVYSKPTSYRIDLYKGTLIASGYNTFTHNNDGNRSFSVYIEGGIYDAAVNVTGSKTFDLDTIPRASQISSAGAVTLGNVCNVTWTPKSASLYYRLAFSLGLWSANVTGIHPNTTAAYTYKGCTIPLDVAKQIVNGYTGTMTVTLYTYSHSSCTSEYFVGTEDSKTFTVTVPTSAKPTVTMTLSPVHSLPAAFNGIYVQGLSKVKATLSATPQYDATILYYDVTVGSKTYGSADNYTSDYLTGTGTVVVAGRAMDSRNYAGYSEGSITITPYAGPKIQNVTAKRCDANGNLSDTGTYLKITAKRSYSPVMSNNIQKNFCDIRYRYKVEGASSYSSWVTILQGDDPYGDTITTGALLKGNLATTSSYLIQVQAIDTIGNTALAEVIIPTEKVYWHRDGANNALGLGKYAETPDTLDSAWNLKTAKNVIAAGDATIGGTMYAAHLGPIESYHGLDFNNLISQTGYYIATVVPSYFPGTANYPVDKTGMLTVVANGLFAYQTYATHDGAIYTRSYYHDRGWTEWKQIQLI